MTGSKERFCQDKTQHEEEKEEEEEEEAERKKI